MAMACMDECWMENIGRCMPYQEDDRDILAWFEVPSIWNQHHGHQTLDIRSIMEVDTRA